MYGKNRKHNSEKLLNCSCSASAFDRHSQLQPPKPANDKFWLNAILLKYLPVQKNYFYIIKLYQYRVV